MNLSSVSVRLEWHHMLSSAVLLRNMPIFVMCSFTQRACHDLKWQASKTGFSTPWGRQGQALKMSYLTLGMTLPVHQVINNQAQPQG